MAKVWQIRRLDGGNVKFEWEMPGQMSESEISATLQRLVACHLSESEIVSASLRKGSSGYRSLLERVGRGRPISYGENPYYTADLKDK
jgi:hypothetical protein